MRPHIDGYFLLASIQNDVFVSKVLDKCTGTSYPAINPSTLSKISILIPSLSDEQAKIGQFFKQFDDAIALKEQELAAMQQAKQGFLQKMFV